MNFQVRIGVMKIESEKQRLDVCRADLPGSRFDDVNLSNDLNMSGWRIHNVNLAGLRVEKANMAGVSIDGIAVTDLLACWRAGHGANSA